MGFLEQVYFNNTIKQWIAALVLLLLVQLVLRLLKGKLAHRLAHQPEQDAGPVHGTIRHLLAKTNFFLLFFVSLFFATMVLELPGRLVELLDALVVIALLIQAGIWGNGLISLWIGQYSRQKMADDAATATTLNALGFITKLALWSIILLLALANMGVNITGLVAGLGIGGIAIALALQNILSDLFASLSIVLDKPFVLGDFVIIDNHLGTVEYIGLKTTRIRSLHGEQLVMSNSDLLNSRIRNFKRMKERRILFNLGVTYQTPREKIARIPGLIRAIIEEMEYTRFDRAHFTEFGDFSLNFEIVYWMTVPDFAVYRDTQQAINLKIHEAFEREGIEFAYPTQTLHVVPPVT